MFSLSDRRVRKMARRLLHDARYWRLMRGDIAERDVVEKTLRAEDDLRAHLKGGNAETIEAKAKTLSQAMEPLSAQRAPRALRENLEILVVAVAVAMAFRTYFVQPFKIPTGSMQPTLYGIHFEPQPRPRWRDRGPLKLINWVVFGEWYHEIRAVAPGRVGPSGYAPLHPDAVELGVGHVRYGYTNLYARVAYGDEVVTGQVLASGLKLSGDHIFVNKILWNFRRPRRGEIVVFSTDGIDHPQIRHGTFYIKRMVGVPGDELSIRQPYLCNHGKPVVNPYPYNIGIDRLHNRERGYEEGYKLPDFNPLMSPPPVLRSPDDVIALGPDEFFALGDNTSSSLDGRYWGSLRRPSLVGPAFIVYWPVSRRWGRLLR
ncbi:MAG: signal peptidase I [Kiritimatiellae bacterium]|nr:signal peptidase I [Kiritimatiellia bacterium]